MPHVQIQKEVLHVLAILASVATELIVKVNHFVCLLLIATILECYTFKKPTLYSVFLDIDECVSGENNCHNDYATCFNTIGNFTCSCNSGYRGDGVNCQGKKMTKITP